MPIRGQFSFFIIGEGTLPIQCAEVLLDRGHKICGIISPDATVNHWAEGKSIPYADPIDDLIAFLRRHPFDYLLSIVNIANYWTLLKESLRLPRKCAINYHDALLPRYAGFHTTSWALMHRETIHGVTWHLMTGRIDAGDILRQCPVDIANDDTAFTLNAKCYDAAIRSFAELVEDLSCGRALGKKQNLDQRTYFPLYKRSPAGCVLRWNQCAQDIEALVRALDFGPYPNPLGLPKLVIGEDFIIVGKTEVLDSRSETPPGTVTKIDHSSIQISTGSREMALHKLLTIDGQPLSIPDAVARLGLHVGHRFRDTDAEQARRISKLNALICKHETFWVKRLAALRPVALPYAARNGPQVKPAKYASVSWLIPEKVTLFLEDRHGAWGLGDFLLAAFVVYLARVGGVCRFDVGFRAAELRRDLAGLEGLFARHVPLRVDMENTQSFAEVFCVVREQVALVTRHKTYARDAVARYPVLRSARERWTEQTLPLIVEQVERSDDYKAAPGSEFTFLIQEDKAKCRWIYDAEILDGGSVARMLRQFNTLLQDITINPDRRIAELLLLSEEERHQLLVEFNDTDVDYPEGQCIHELFEAQVERTPDAVAMVFEAKQTTYQELNSRANQLAHHLKKRGIGPESLVAICMERSTDMIVAMLGILKAGGAYVPLDPTYPQVRLAFMLEDSQARVVLTQERLHASLPPAVDAVCLDTDWERIAKESDRDSVPCPDPDNLAYVIYTSGSTGQPKGVMIEHKSLVNYLSWVDVSLLGEKVRRVPMVSSLSFDASLKQLFAPLLRGDQVWILEDDIVAEPATLLQVLGKQTRVGLNCVPSLWKSALDMSEFSQAAFPAQSLTCLFLGGEPLSKDLVMKSRAMLPDLQIWNLYGPTETTANASAARIIPSEHVSIGRPIANVQIYLLDQHQQPVPIGVAGELHIGGDCLARGYNNRAELTAESFIPNPFSLKRRGHVCTEPAIWHATMRMATFIFWAG